MAGGKKEADTQVAQGFLGRFRCSFQIEAQGFQSIGCTGLGTGCAIAVLRNGNAAGRNDQ